MSRQNESKDIEVLEGLEPVKRRPGMHTDTSRPNHLAMEVIDNSIDEALATTELFLVEGDWAKQKLMDMLLSKKRATDRKSWLETKGDLATV